MSSLARYLTKNLQIELYNNDLLEKAPITVNSCSKMLILPIISMCSNKNGKKCFTFSANHQSVPYSTFIIPVIGLYYKEQLKMQTCK